MIASSRALIANESRSDFLTVIVVETAAQKEVASPLKEHLTSKAAGAYDIVTSTDVLKGSVGANS
jgi:hypothetical protein